MKPNSVDTEMTATMAMSLIDTEGMTPIIMDTGKMEQNLMDTERMALNPMMDMDGMDIK